MIVTLCQVHNNQNVAACLPLFLTRLSKLTLLSTLGTHLPPDPSLPPGACCLFVLTLKVAFSYSVVTGASQRAGWVALIVVASDLSSQYLGQCGS